MSLVVLVPLIQIFKVLIYPFKHLFSFFTTVNHLLIEKTVFCSDSVIRSVLFYSTDNGEVLNKCFNRKLLVDRLKGKTLSALVALNGTKRPKPSGKILSYD